MLLASGSRNRSLGRKRRFYQSTLAFNPLQPGEPSVMSLILRPSINMTSGQAREYHIQVFLPGFVRVFRGCRVILVSVPGVPRVLYNVRSV